MTKQLETKGLTLTINTDNEAFVDDVHGAVAELLRQVADRIEVGYTGGFIRDQNGNKVGNYYLY